MKTVCSMCNREIHGDRLSKTTEIGGIVPKELQIPGKVKHGICSHCLESVQKQHTPHAYESFRNWENHKSKGA